MTSRLVALPSAPNTATTHRTRKPVPSSKPARPGWRSDIQGLRALAVLAVVINHAVGVPSGGFVGVDIFFVISGFVITQLLFREAASTGRIDLLAFFARRVKRITPPAVLVLGVVLLVSPLVFSASRASSVQEDGLWSFLLLANWHFAATGTDYFQATSALSPLQHFWSLAVEEQFYVIWPILLIELLILCRGRIRRFRSVVGALSGAVVVGSVVWALFDTSQQPVVAYFSTGSRAWEIAAGALVASVSPLLERTSRLVSAGLVWSGLLGMAAAFVLLDESTPFPAPGAVLPVVATMLVILGGTAGHRVGVGFLGGRTAGMLGASSYALYLWHFPVIVLADEFISTSPLRVPVILVISGLLAGFTHYNLERPINSSPLLTSYSSDSARRAAFVKWRESLQGRFQRLGLIQLGLLTAVLVGAAMIPQSSAPAGQLAVPTFTAGGSDEAEKTKKITAKQLTAGLTSALKATAWPTLDESEKSRVGGDDATPAVTRCSGSDSPSCRFGSAKATKSVLLAGDSTSLAYSQAFIDMATKSKASGTWSVDVRGMFGCAFIDLTYSNADDKVRACDEHKRQVVERVKNDKPDFVVVTNLHGGGSHKDAGKTITPDEYGAAVESTITSIASADTKVIVLPPLPTEADVEKCFTPRSTPGDCITHVNGFYTQIQDASRAAAERTGAAYVDTQPLGCVDGRCPAFFENVLVKSDLNYITPAFAHVISPVLQKMLQPLGAMTASPMDRS